jgi:hypothetical protein
MLRNTGQPGRQEQAMNFEERVAGDFKIYTGAIERREGGYQAAVVVQRIRGVDAPRTVYTADALSNGYRFASVQVALQRAMEAGEREIRLLQAFHMA